MTYVVISEQKNNVNDPDELAFGMLITSFVFVQRFTRI